MSFKWKNGRQLSKITVNNKSVNMEYDTNGMRLLKDDDDYITNYYYDSNKNPGYQFVEGDLYYSIQHCSVYVANFCTNRKRYLRVLLSDTYDFDNYRDILVDGELSIGNAANDLGLLLQNTGLLTKYKWSVSFTYYF